MTEQVTDFMYLGNMISKFKTYITTKIHSYNKINGTEDILVKICY
jgi:hypothetical protein